MDEQKKWVIILIGPPGSGKGTQAELLAEKFGLFHLESSKIIEERLNKADLDDWVLQNEKRLWESGALNTPELVLRWIQEKIKEVTDKGQGIVFSGSPRTVFEAEGVMPLLEELYGKGSIKVFNLDLSEAESIKRNSKRRICIRYRHPIPDLPEFKNIVKCPKDGSELITRVLDNPKIISVSYEEYFRRTVPVVDILKYHGYRVIKIKGGQSIEAVHGDILKYLD